LHKFIEAAGENIVPLWPIDDLSASLIFFRICSFGIRALANLLMLPVA
jgi:hypothetical protein